MGKMLIRGTLALAAAAFLTGCATDGYYTTTREYYYDPAPVVYYNDPAPVAYYDPGPNIYVDLP